MTLIRGMLMLVVATAMAALLAGCGSSQSGQYVTCDEFMLGKTGHCYAPEDVKERYSAEVCVADSRKVVYDYTSCKPYSTLPPPGLQFCTDTFCVDTLKQWRSYRQMWDTPKCHRRRGT